MTDIFARDNPIRTSARLTALGRSHHPVRKPIHHGNQHLPVSANGSGGCCERLTHSLPSIPVRAAAIIEGTLARSMNEMTRSGRSRRSVAANRNARRPTRVTVFSSPPPAGNFKSTTLPPTSYA